MKKIINHLWFDKEAREAANFYISAFKSVALRADESKITDEAIIHNTPSGTVDIITVNILGQDFTLINAGPFFK